ncbi:hypothetical protein DUNSADRAFT_1607 [Dunaliella salina]|uniref:PAS domain-containing protein n=1 Tax=Dunaliella salina TaxID=3046 RepID=A0ABQ7H8J1_DUNSA|nr:hypothetical protein DUNSADRAFT_1607 [Dunaliella salina]|eukprot:KAF5843180.1 hypothetical protein DUNSADRAFT_1607 [Dunaliella salina]
MLGRQPEEMVHLEMHDIMPQPFGLMHPKWMKDQEQRPTRPPPSSCRAGVVQTLLSANGAHVHARLKMSIREMGDNFSHIVKAEKVLPNEYLADRCLHVHVNELGQIVWASKTPKHVAREHCAPAYKGAACKGAGERDPPATAQSQVGQLEMDGEKSAEPLMSIKLWRPESVTCVAEVDENLSVVKCDPAASLLFGISHADIVQRPITNVLKLPKGSHAQQQQKRWPAVAQAYKPDDYLIPRSQLHETAAENVVLRCSSPQTR